MARLVSMWQNYDPSTLQPKQMPLVVDEFLSMVMDITGLKALRESPLVQGKQLDEFTKKYNLLTMEEKKKCFEVACKDLLSNLDQYFPCIGCRRSVERLFFELSNLSGHPALDPLVVSYDGFLSIRTEVIQNPQRVCTLFQGHSSRLNDLVDQQTINKKSRRCTLHSLEVQRTRPATTAWKEVWDCMENDCLKEMTFIDSDTLDVTLNTYLRKHKFCSDCRTKVQLASSLLTTETDPTKEKGYVSSLYAGIKRCTGGHVHLPLNTEYISSIIGRAQPEIMGRERHAKTLEIAQEEVLTCLGICVAERLNRVYRRLKEEEIIIKLLAVVAVDTLSRNLQMAVEFKQGITQLEVLYKEFKREEIAKLQRREKLRLKKKKKKERRAEMEGKENECEKKEDTCEVNNKLKCEASERLNSNECKNQPSSEHLMDEHMDTNKRCTMWIEVKKRLNTKALNRNCRSSSEHSSQDFGYSSEHNISSSSLPSTPEGSEVACSDGCCGHEGDCPDTRSTDKLNHSDSSLCILKEYGGGLTLSQMLEDSYLSEDEGNCSYIPVEEVLEFKSRMCQVTEKRQELRQTLKKRFAMLCSHHKPFTIPR